MKASFSTIGSVPRSRAIAGKEVAITVESMFSMNRAEAMMSGMRREAGGICPLISTVIWVELCR